MRDFKVEAECEKAMIVCLVRNNHTTIFAEKKECEKVLEILKKHKYKESNQGLKSKKKFFIINSEIKLSTMYKTFTLIF